MATQTLALVGAAGGAGTTRLTIESGATLARAGYDVALFDAAFETQGMRSYLDGRIEDDVTALLTGDAELGDVLYHHSIDLDGRLAVSPARAPFERLARAKTAGAAERFERQLAATSLSHDVVLIDTPPVGANQALAAVNAADAVAVVTPDSRRGRDALAHTRERFVDIGAEIDTVIANRSEGEELTDVDVHIPETDVTAPGQCPSCVPPDDSFAPAVADALEATLDLDLDLGFAESGRLNFLS